MFRLWAVFDQPTQSYFPALHTKPTETTVFYSIHEKLGRGAFVIRCEVVYSSGFLVRRRARCGFRGMAKKMIHNGCKFQAGLALRNGLCAKSFFRR